MGTPTDRRGALPGRREARSRSFRLWRFVLIAVLVAVLASSWLLWRLLDPGPVIWGTATLFPLPDDGVAVEWFDLSGDRPESRLLVVDAEDRRVFAEDLPSDHRVAGIASSVTGDLVIAEQVVPEAGSITLLQKGSSSRRDLVRPAAVPYYTEMLLRGSELLWISRGANRAAIEATDLATGKTRTLLAAGRAAVSLTALSDGRTIAVVEDGTLVVVDADTGEVRSRVGDGHVVSIAATREGIAFITKEGEPRVLEQCPGDSGPGSDAALRVGHLQHWQGGTVTDLGLEFGKQQPVDVASNGRSDVVLVAAVEPDKKGCPSDPALHQVDVTTGQFSQVLAEHSYGAEMSPSGQEVAYVFNGQLFVRSLASGVEERLNPPGTEALGDVTWTPDGSLWFVSDMKSDRESRGKPRLWLKRPGAGGLEGKLVL